MRELTATELDVLRRLVREIASLPLRQQALDDIEHCLVEPRANNEVLTFHIAGYQRPSFSGQDIYRGVDRFPVGGTVFDADGVRIEVLLMHDKNSRIFELELLKRSGAPIERPNWLRFVPTILPET